MKKGFTFLISLLAISAVFIFSNNGLAQEINDYGSDFSIELVPDNPRPDQAVSAKIVSYQFDVNRSNVVWILDGKIITQGQGKKTADFVLPPLYSASGAISRSNLVYDWTFNYKNLPDDSGMNRNTLLTRLNDTGDYVIGVKVSTKDKMVSAQKYLHLSAEGVSPKLVFYADDPLEGPFYNKSIGNKITLKTKDINIRAEPYFFNKEDGKTAYSWSMNGKVIKSGKKPNTISLVSEENSGQAEISFEMGKETENNLQSAKGRINIAF